MQNINNVGNYAPMEMTQLMAADSGSFKTNREYKDRPTSSPEKTEAAARGAVATGGTAPSSLPRAQPRPAQGPRLQTPTRPRPGLREEGRALRLHHRRACPR